MQQVTVTGYLIPRVGEGPQPVSNYDQNYINKTGEQTVSDVLQNLPAAAELDVVNSSNNTNPTETLDAPNYVHLIGNWTTVDWQISYQFGQPTEVAPETPKAGYSKEGKKIVGEKAIAPAPEGSHWGIRNLLANTTLTFGIDNLFDAHPPFSSDWYQG